jgi:hypothetical protein
MQMCPNHGMVLIRNNYVKTFTILILIGLSQILSWQDCFMSWIQIIIAALLILNLQNELADLGYLYQIRL